MKQKNTLTVKKILFYVFVVIVVVLYLGTQLLKPNKVPNSFKNAGYTGNALFYDTLVKLGYEVDYTLKPLSASTGQGLIILNVATRERSLSDGDYEEIFNRVQAGDKIVVLFQDVTDGSPIFPEDTDFKTVESDIAGQSFTVWSSGETGILIYGDATSMSNTFVSTERENAYKTLQLLHPYLSDGVLFNEYFLYVKQPSRSLWKEMPQGIRFILVQMGIALFLFLWTKGKRFGVPLKLYEEAEPDENQYAKAVGALYHQTGHWEVLIDAYYNHLMHKIYKKHLLYTDIGEQNWMSVFEGQKESKLAQKVYTFMTSYKAGAYEQLSKKKARKRIKEALIAMQTLEKSLEQ